MSETKKKRSPRKVARSPTRAKRPTKKAAKKAAKKTTKKAMKKSSSSSIIKTYKATIKNMRLQAAQDYITDPDGRSVRFHYERDDRDYRGAISIAGFERWSKEDRWTDRRQQFWEEIEVRMLTHIRDEILQARFERLGKMKEAVAYMEEYMVPLRNADGSVRRYPDSHPDYPGLPMYPLKMPSMEKFVRMIMELQDQIRLDSGEAVTRSETISSGKTKVSVTALDPVTSMMTIKPEEARRLAQGLLRDRFAKQMEDAAALDGEVVAADAERDRDGSQEEEEL